MSFPRYERTAYKGTLSKLNAVRCRDFNLGMSLTSGQVFRWRPWQGGFIGWIDSNLTFLSQENGRLHFQGTSPQAIQDFFSLDLDLRKIARQIDVDETIHKALESFWGLRVIRQNLWECLASFILSSFNNIPRLTGMLDRLARYQDPGGQVTQQMLETFPLATRYQFPRPEVIAKVSERVLRHLGLGFRAPYLKAAAQALAEGRVDLEEWRGLEDEALRRALKTIPGIGEKVVECVMLFGFCRHSAFPVDVWIGRAMRAWYFPKNPKVTDRKIREFAYRHFGHYCGWAQQFLYCQARGQARGRLHRGHPSQPRSVLNEQTHPN